LAPLPTSEVRQCWSNDYLFCIHKVYYTYRLQFFFIPIPRARFSIHNGDGKCFIFLSPGGKVEIPRSTRSNKINAHERVSIWFVRHTIIISNTSYTILSYSTMQMQVNLNVVDRYENSRITVV